MNSKKLAWHRENGRFEDSKFDRLAAIGDKREEETPRITTIETIEELQKSATQQNFKVKINLDTFIGLNKLLVELDNRIFPTYQKVDIYGLNTYYADVFVDLSIPRTEENFTLTTKLFSNTNSLINSKSITVKVKSDGKVRETDEKVEGGIKDSEESNENNDCQKIFDKVAQIILKHEGGYVDDPDDTGGKTNKGISWETWVTYANEDLNVKPTVENLKNLTVEQAKVIYKKRYWEPKGFCIIKNLKIALMFYDWTITSGGAWKEFTKLLEDEYDQSIEKNKKLWKNIANAINNVENQDKLLNDLTQIRKDYYVSLAYKTNKDGTFKKDENENLIKTKNYKFLNGWLKRVDDCLNYKL